MAYPDPRMARDGLAGARSGASAVDLGLRAFMLSVYNHMTLGVALTGAVALGLFLMATTRVGGAIELTEFGRVLYTSPLQWVLILAPLGIVFWMSFGAARLSAATARLLFYLYAALVGGSLSTIFLVYTGASIAQVFFVTAATFGALSLYGYTTKRDLAPIGTFLFMGLIGLILASVVNWFLASSALDFAVSVAGVVIFAGLTAWDTQKLKTIYAETAPGEARDKVAVFGALSLYLDFLNLFMMLLRLLGDRR